MPICRECTVPEWEFSFGTVGFKVLTIRPIGSTFMPLKKSNVADFKDKLP